MNFEFSRFLYTLIQTKFPGGRAKFAEDGGSYIIIPKTPDELLIYHPNLSIEFKNYITQAVSSLQLTTHFVTTLNYKGQEPSEVLFIYETKISKIIEDLHLENSIQATISELLNIFVLTDLHSTRALAEKLINRIREVLPSCIRSCVIYGDKQLAWFEYPQTETPAVKSAPQAVLEAHSRTTVIGNDDLLNLRIALGNAQTVDDFINSI